MNYGETMGKLSKKYGKRVDKNGDLAMKNDDVIMIYQQEMWKTW